MGENIEIIVVIISNDSSNLSKEAMTYMPIPCLERVLMNVLS
jgi:hypothetical protein